MTCTNCGTDNKDGYRFCANCGSKLEAPEPDEGVRGSRPEKPFKPVVTDTPQVSKGLIIASLFIPGLGHFMNGNTQKGALLLGGAVLLVLTGIGYLIVGIYSAYDVYKTGGRPSA